MSSIRRLKRPGMMIDGSSVNVIPALQRRLVLGRDERALVDVHADAVPHPVAEVLAEARVLDRPPAGGVDLARRRPGRRGGAPGLLRGEHDLVGLEVVGGGSPQ